MVTALMTAMFILFVLLAILAAFAAGWYFRGKQKKEMPQAVIEDLERKQREALIKQKQDFNFMNYTGDEMPKAEADGAKMHGVQV